MDVTSRIWTVACSTWSAISDSTNQISYYILIDLGVPVLAWWLHIFALCATIWHLHLQGVSRVQRSHERSSTRFLDAIGDAMEEMKKSEASTAAARLMVALAALNADTAQAWVCLLLAPPLYLDHVADAALKVPNAAQRISLWATSVGLHLLDAARAASNATGQASDILLFLFLRRFPSAPIKPPIKARVGASKARAAATSLRVTGALRALDGAVGGLLHLASSSTAAATADALHSAAQMTSTSPSTRGGESHHLWNLASNTLASTTGYLTPALATAGRSLRDGATTTAGAAAVRTAATILATAAVRCAMQAATFSQLGSIIATAAALAVVATSAWITTHGRTHNTCLMLLYIAAAAWQYSNHFTETSAETMTEAVSSAAGATTSTIANHLAATASTTTAGAFAATFISITQATGHHKGLELPQRRSWQRAWGGGITPQLQWEDDAFECSADRTVRVLSPGLRRLHKLGPRASGHKKGEKRQPTQGLEDALQRKQDAHHERLAYVQQYKAYIEEERSKPNLSCTLNTEDWPDTELVYIRMAPTYTQRGETCVLHAAANSRLPRTCSRERYTQMLLRVANEMNQCTSATKNHEAGRVYDWSKGAPTTTAFAAAPERSLRRGQFCLTDWQSLSRADTNWLSPSMARQLQSGDEITVTTTKLIEAGRVNPDGSKTDWTHHFTFRVSVQRNGTAMTPTGLRHDVPALHYDISDSASYSAEEQKDAMEQVALNSRMHQRIMRAYNDGYKAVQAPKYEHHSAIVMDAKTKMMREIKALPEETIGGLLIREGYRRAADATTAQTVTNLGPLPSTTRMEHFGSMSGTSSDTEIPEGWVIITNMAAERKHSVETTIPVQTLLTGNLPHDIRMARLDPSELKSASAKDIVSIVTGSDNWTDIFACCELEIGGNNLPTMQDVGAAHAPRQMDHSGTTGVHGQGRHPDGDRIPTSNPRA